MPVDGFRAVQRRQSRGPRPAESWDLAVIRSREAYDRLRQAGYTDQAAAAILSTAYALWSDTALQLGQ